MKSFITIFQLPGATKKLLQDFNARSTQQIIQESRNTVAAVGQNRIEDFSKILQEMEQTENKRCEIIDTKSHIIIAASATALAMLCKVAESASSSDGISFFLQLSIFVTGISWVAAAICAFRVTTVTGFHQISSSDIRDWLPADFDFKQMAATKRLYGIRANEAKLLIKTNYLSTAQSFFVEGLISLVFVLLTLLAKPWFEPASKWLDGASGVLHFSIVIAAIVAGQCVVITVVFIAMYWLLRLCGVVGKA